MSGCLLTARTGSLHSRTALAASQGPFVFGADFLGGLLQSFRIDPNGRLHQNLPQALPESVFAALTGAHEPLGLRTHPFLPILYVDVTPISEVAVYRYDERGELSFVQAVPDSGAAPNPQVSLKQGSRGLTGSHHRAQSTLVIVQMALTLILLAGAGLLVRTIRQLWEVNPGFDARHILTFKVGLSPSVTKEVPRARIAYQHLLEHVRKVPGVDVADLIMLIPLSQQVNIGPFWPNSQQLTSVTAVPRALFYWTGPDFLKAMGIRLLRGSYFAAENSTETERVVVIDSVLAHAYFPDKDPVGQSLNIPHWGVARIIGVVAHVKRWGLGDQQNYTDNQIYASLYQLPDEWASLFYQNVTVTVRTTSIGARFSLLSKRRCLGPGVNNRCITCAPWRRWSRSRCQRNGFR